MDLMGLVVTRNADLKAVFLKVLETIQLLYTQQPNHYSIDQHAHFGYQPTSLTTKFRSHIFFQNLSSSVFFAIFFLQIIASFTITFPTKGHTSSLETVSK